jgi:hypothetical protein
MISVVVATSIADCGVCTAVAHYAALSTHTTAWNTLCHNAANHKDVFLLINSTTKNCSFSKAQYKLPEDGPGGTKHVEASIEIF